MSLIRKSLGGILFLSLTFHVPGDNYIQIYYRAILVLYLQITKYRDTT